MRTSPSVRSLMVDEDRMMSVVDFPAWVPASSFLWCFETCGTYSQTCLLEYWRKKTKGGGPTAHGTRLPPPAVSNKIKYDARHITHVHLKTVMKMEVVVSGLSGLTS